MAVITNAMDYIQLYESLQATGTFDSVAEAINSGVVHQVTNGNNIINFQAAYQAVNGGKGMPVISYDDALQVAKAAQNLGATAASVITGAGILAKSAVEAGKYTLVGACTLELPMVASMCAPLAGVALGEGLYNENPSLWTKISQTLMPYCYAENKIQAYLEYFVDPTTGVKNPIMCLATPIIDALKDLFTKEDVHVYRRYEKTSGDVTLNGGDLRYVAEKLWYGIHSEKYISMEGKGAVYPDAAGGSGYCVGTVVVKSRNYTYQVGPGWIGNFSTFGINVGSNPYPDRVIQAVANNEYIPTNEEEPTPGVDVPVIDPWTFPGFSPDFPIIIVEPGSEPEELPVTPVTPLLPATDPTPELPGYAPGTTPLLPEHIPDPETIPENWPEEEPWPTTIPFPYTDPVPSTEPTPSPNWPEIMPWPLPSDPPSEWPTVPEEWPWEFPEEIPWPYTPNQWPEEVPWPETPPEWWPEDVPWPETPEDWPEEVPWPTPWPENWPTYPPSWPEPFPKELPWPTSPDEWPEEVPWPETPPEWWPQETPWPESPNDWPEEAPWPVPPIWPIPWPPNLPYPWPNPYPNPSPNPYPDPTKLEDPTKQIDPYIDPWPYPWPSPTPEPSPSPDPYRDPSQPSPAPNPDPSPTDPIDPYPMPPSGTPTPPILPILPLPFSSTTGLISVYHPTQSELLSFASWLWVTWQDATIDKIWNNPFDGVITLFELYCTPTDVGRKNIRSGFLDSGVNSAIISRYTEINCGSIAVPEYYGNYFDYAPYSKCHIYLPFIGIVELNVDDIVGHGVNVTYRIDEYNGSCIAMITCAKSTSVNGTEVDYSSVIYQFSGNCAVELPLAGGSQAAIKAGMIEAAAWGLGSVIGGVMGGASLGQIGQGLAYGAASAVHSVVSAKSSVQHSGSFGSSYGAMGAKNPYLIVTRPKQIQVPNYNALYGYQAHKMVRIGDCSGYLRCREVHVISLTASDEEKAQIEQLLKTGVYVTE